jgi:hypothetical protein
VGWQPGQAAVRMRCVASLLCPARCAHVSAAHAAHVCWVFGRSRNTRAAAACARERPGVQGAVVAAVTQQDDVQRAFGRIVVLGRARCVTSASPLRVAALAPAGRLCVCGCRNVAGAQMCVQEVVR